MVGQMVSRVRGKDRRHTSYFAGHLKTKFSRRSCLSTPRMESAHKPHRAPHAGAKAEKKKAKRNGDSGHKGKNPKAFTMSGKRSTEKQARRSAEVQSGPWSKESKNADVVLDERKEASRPNGREDTRRPAAGDRCGRWAVGGILQFAHQRSDSQSQVGKTTLIKSLVRRYSKHTLSEVLGPITVVSGRN